MVTRNWFFFFMVLLIFFVPVATAALGAAGVIGDRALYFLFSHVYLYFPIVIAVGIVGTAVVGLIGALRRQREHRRIRSWGRRHGFARWSGGDNAGVATHVAMFQANRTAYGPPACDSVLRGGTSDGRPLVVGHLTAVRERSSRRAWVPYVGALASAIDVGSWTFVQTRLGKEEATVFGARLALDSRSILERSTLDALGDVASSLHHVQLESAELERAYRLRVGDRAHDGAVRAMFSPRLIAWLIDQAPHGLCCQLQSRTLTTWLSRRVIDERGLDDLLSGSLILLDALVGAARTVIPRADASRADTLTATSSKQESR